MSNDTPKKQEKQLSPESGLRSRSVEAQEQKDQTAEKEQQRNNAEAGPPKPSLFKKFFDFVRNPERSNAVVAIFTVVIAVTGLFYTVFAALQWNEVRKSVAVTQQQLADARAVQAARLVIEMPIPETREETGNLWAKGIVRISNVGGTVAAEVAVIRTYGGGVEFPTFPAHLETIPKPNPQGQSISNAKPLEFQYNMLLGETSKLRSRQFYASCLVQVGYKDVFGTTYQIYALFVYDPLTNTYYSR